MEKKLSKIIGITKEEFDTYVNNGDIRLSEARLIPPYKLGDELALTSVLLTALRLIKEFRKLVLASSNMSSSGNLYAYTEVEFRKHKELGRVDGLLILVRGGKIVDAAIFEMKNGTDDLNSQQLERYQQLAREYAIPRMITVSNQFVSEPTQCPIEIKTLKGVEMFHFSWSALLTIAHVLLFKNDTNIEDEDQVEIMIEVVKYLENKKSGVMGFHQMKPGWGEVVDKISASASLKSDDRDVCDAVISWQQEEKDMALILSRHLGVFVDSGERKYKGNLSKRWADDTNSLLRDKALSSSLRVRDAVSEIGIIGQLEKRTIEMSVSLKAPHDRTYKGQIGWLRRQLEYCQKRDPKSFSKLQDKIHIDTKIKNSRSAIRMNISNIDNLYEEVKNKEISEFKIVYINYFGKRFASPKKFVENIEQMLIDFYSCIVQHLKKWEPSAPKMPQPLKNEYLPSLPKPEKEVAEVSSNDSDIIEEPEEKPLEIEHQESQDEIEPTTIQAEPSFENNLAQSEQSDE